MSLKSRVLGFLKHGSLYGTKEDHDKNREAKKLFHQALVDKYGEKNVIDGYEISGYGKGYTTKASDWIKSSRPLHARDVNKLNRGILRCYDDCKFDVNFKVFLMEENRRCGQSYMTYLKNFARYHGVRTEFCESSMSEKLWNVLKTHPRYGKESLTDEEIHGIVWPQISEHFEGCSVADIFKPEVLPASLLKSEAVDRSGVGKFMEFKGESNKSRLVAKRENGSVVVKKENLSVRSRIKGFFPAEVSGMAQARTEKMTSIQKKFLSNH